MIELTIKLGYAPLRVGDPQAPMHEASMEIRANGFVTSLPKRGVATTPANAVQQLLDQYSRQINEEARVK